MIGGSLAYLVETGTSTVNPAFALSGSANWGATNAVFIAGNSSPPVSPALVSHVALIGNGTTSEIDTTGATLLVVNTTAFLGGGPVPTITDSKGNTWHALTQHSNNSYAQQLFYAWNPTVGTGHTFTGTGGFASTFEVAAFSGIKTTADPFEVEAGAGVTGFDGQGGSVTATVPGSLYISGFGLQNNQPSNETSGLDLGFVMTDNTSNPTQTSFISGALAYLVQSSTTARNPTWFTRTSSQNFAIGNAVFAPAASPSVTRHGGGTFR